MAIDDWRLPIQEQSRNLYSPGAQVPQRVIAAEGSTLFFTSPFPVRELYAAKKSILGCLYIRKDDQIYDVF